MAVGDNLRGIVEARQEQRTARRTARQQQKTQRQQRRQSARAQRQQVRQQNRTQRTMARQTRRTVKELQKGQSGFYTPEGQQARFQGIVDVTGAGTDAAKTIAAGIATQGASLAADGTLEQLGGVLGAFGPQDSTGFQAGAPAAMAAPAPVGFFEKPLNIALLAGGGLALFFLLRR